jgi:hypothetical protein
MRRVTHAISMSMLASPEFKSLEAGTEYDAPSILALVGKVFCGTYEAYLAKKRLTSDSEK